MRASFALLFAASAAAAQGPRTGRILAANQQSGSASVIELATGNTTHIPVGTGPHEVAISPDGKWGFVSIYGIGGQPGNQLAVIDMAAKKVARMIDLGRYTRPHSIVPVAGSPLKLIVSSETTRNAVVVDAEQGVVIGAVPTEAAASHMVAVQADGKRAYSANIQPGTMTALDMVAGKAVGSVEIGPRSEGLATSWDGNEVWVGSMGAGTVSVVNVAAMKVDTVLTGFGVPYRMAVSPDKKFVVVNEAEANRATVIDGPARRPLGVVDLGGSPRGINISADSRWAFVALGPQNEVVVIDLSNRQVVARYPVQTAPDGVAYSSK
jgi:YVTN family beta-propeller protein